MKRLSLLLMLLLLLPLCAMAVTSVPGGVTVVEDDAFADSGIDALIIPASVEQVGANVLAGCNASYLYLEGANTALTAASAKDVPFIFASAASAAASLDGFYATESLVLEGGLYYAVTDTALPLCARAPFSLTGSVTIPKLVNGKPVTSLDELYLANANLAELLAPAYLTIPDGLNATPYQTMSVTAPTAYVTESPAGHYITWETSVTGAYGDVSYLWTFTQEEESVTRVTAEPAVQYAPGNEGSITVTVTAEDSLGDSAVSQPSQAVTITAAQPTYRALLVGNTYPGELETLPGCDVDTAAVKAMLSAMNATAYQVTMVNNVTASGIRSYIASAFAGAQPGDVSLFYYSGHGNQDGSLVGTGGTLLTIYTLRSALQAIPGTKVVILDCCYSGAVINRSARSTSADPSAFNSAVISAFAAKTRSSVNLEDAGYIVLTACTKDQQSKSITDRTKGIAFGAFTYSLCYGSGYDEWNSVALSTLPADADGNAAITLREAYADIGPRVDELDAMVGGALDQSLQYSGDPAFVMWRK